MMVKIRRFLAFLLRFFAATGLGYVHTMAFAPREWWWLEIAALTGLCLLLVEASRVGKSNGYLAMLGWGFGMGWFGSGLWWLYISMHVYGGLDSNLAIAAIAALCAFISLYPALAAWLFGRLAMPYAEKISAFAQHPPVSIHGAFLFAAAWGLTEWLRGNLLTGFPWLASGYAHTSGQLSAYAPIFGVYGLGFLAALIAALITVLIVNLIKLRWTTSVFALLIGAGVLASPLLFQESPWTSENRQGLDGSSRISIRLLQGNVPQEEKFGEANVGRSMALYEKLITAKPADLIITPETAFPVFGHELPASLLQRLQQFSTRTQSHILFGVAMEEPGPFYTNSMLGMTPGQAIGDGKTSSESLISHLYRYNKHHLVPFGEFIPDGFHWFTRMMNIPLGDFNRGEMVQAPFEIKTANGTQKVMLNICYEDLFGEEIAAHLRQSDTTSNILLNVSNIGWFGNTIAIPQHLQISRMRAMETGRPMIRATNTGATAIIGPQGRVLEELTPFTQDEISAEVTGFRGTTPYVLWENWPVLGFCSVLIVLSFAFTWRIRAE
ncbi:apolipoprotein N-acyltransferase [Ampullimonas aquatilis]|uniref:apolipoprotein N-acyltransferase n=1 Tax=Ampullimonas aquatilis TaxID=1341549 RepID=UPI003C7884B2